MAHISARDRANSVLAKYEDRAKGVVSAPVPTPPDVSAGLPIWWGELRQDIENAVRSAAGHDPIDPLAETAATKAAKAKADAEKAAKVKADDEAAYAAAKTRAPTTHMPATGSHAKK